MQFSDVLGPSLSNANCRNKSCMRLPHHEISSYKYLIFLIDHFKKISDFFKVISDDSNTTKSDYFKTISDHSHHGIVFLICIS